MFFNQIVGADSAEAVIVDVNTLPASPKNVIYRTPGGVNKSVAYGEEKTLSDYISELSSKGFGEYTESNGVYNFTNITNIIYYYNASQEKWVVIDQLKDITYNDYGDSHVLSMTIYVKNGIFYTNFTVYLSSTYPTFNFKVGPFYNYYAGDEETGSYTKIIDFDYFSIYNKTAVCDCVCSSGGSDYTKVARCDNYILRSGNRFTLLFTNANTSASALTLNVNDTGAKAIYINGEASSATNYTLPAGLYSVLYDGTNYQINTDNTIPGVGSGDFDRYKEVIAYLDDEEEPVTPVTDPVIRESDLAQTLSTSTSVPPSVGLLKSTVDNISNISSERLITVKTKTTPKLKIWIPKTWSGLTNITGGMVWTDGDNIYYSSGTSHYILNKKTSTWEEKTWYGLTDFSGYFIWTDGIDIYYSLNGNNYVLDKETSTWSSKTWTGLTDIRPNCVWTDGNGVYYSDGSSQYVLNRETSTWTTKTWSGLTSFYGNQIWTDGDNIYWSSYTNNYVLNRETSTWTSKPWNGTVPSNGISGNNIWSDGKDIYSSYLIYDPPATVSEQYVFNKETFSWSEKIWPGMEEFAYIDGNSVWTDGTNIYHSGPYTEDNQYILTNKNNESDIVSSADITRINNNLGNPSSASAVTGADAFSKINKLNSDLADKVDISNIINFENLGAVNANGTVTLTSSQIFGTATNCAIAFLMFGRSQRESIWLCTNFYNSSRVGVASLLKLSNTINVEVSGTSFVVTNTDASYNNYLYLVRLRHYS